MGPTMAGTSMVYQALFRDIQAPMGVGTGAALWDEFSDGSHPRSTAPTPYGVSIAGPVFQREPGSGFCLE